MTTDESTDHEQKPKARNRYALYAHDRGNKETVGSILLLHDCHSNEHETATVQKSILLSLTS